jgi:hypothetical protein
MADLVIRIAASSKAFSQELDKVRDQTEALEKQLASVAKVSAVAFTAAAAGIGLSVRAFAEAEEVQNKLQAVLKATGGAAGLSKDQIAGMAGELQKVTTFGDEAILSGQTMLATFTRIGRDVFPEASKAMLDLATHMGGDVDGAAKALGKALNDPIEGLSALSKAGVKFTSDQERQIQTMIRAGDIASAQGVILKTLEGRFGGMAEAAAQGLGVWKQNANLFGELGEAIGKQFAPAAEMAGRAVRSLLTFLSENEQVAKFAAAAATAVAVVGGLGTVIGTASLLFLKFRAAMMAAGLATSAMSVGIKALVGATGIGLLVIVLTELALNWDKIWPKMSGVLQVFVQRGSQLLGGFKEILAGVFTLDTERVKKGMAQTAQAMQQGWNESVAAMKFSSPEVPGAERSTSGSGGPTKEEIQKLADQRKVASKEEIEQLRMKNEEIILENQGHGQRLLELKREQHSLQKLLDDENGVMDKDALRIRLEENRLLQAEQEQLDRDQRAIFREEFLVGNDEFQMMSEEQKATFLARNQGILQGEILTEKTARDKAAKDRLDQQIKTNNEFLVNQEKYGKAYAMINKIMHSEVFQGTMQAMGEMSAWIRSEQQTLKVAGQVAATTQIAVQTAVSAMNIFTGWSTIPFVGYALGIAGAAGAVLYGAEQIRKVWAAAEGGVMTGGIPGRDSIPTLTMPGELVTPTKNFDEVVNAVAEGRALELAKMDGAPSGAGAGGVVRVMIDLTRNAARLVTAQQLEERDLGTYRGA